MMTERRSSLVGSLKPTLLAARESGRDISSNNNNNSARLAQPTKTNTPASQRANQSDGSQNESSLFVCKLPSCLSDSASSNGRVRPPSSSSSSLSQFAPLALATGLELAVWRQLACSCSCVGSSLAKPQLEASARPLPTNLRGRERASTSKLQQIYHLVICDSVCNSKGRRSVPPVGCGAISQRQKRTRASRNVIARSLARVRCSMRLLGAHLLLVRSLPRKSQHTFQRTHPKHLPTSSFSFNCKALAFKS